MYFICSGISMLCFTNAGEALYMMSSSELQRISLSTDKVIIPQGTVDLHPLKLEATEKEDNDDEKSSNATNVDVDSEKTNASYVTSALNGVPNDSALPSVITSTTTAAVNKQPAESAVIKPLEVQVGLTNGLSSSATSSGGDNSPNRANETISSSIGDITVDSVRDHLNSTTTTLLSTTTEETVGKYQLENVTENYTARHSLEIYIKIKYAIKLVGKQKFSELLW